MNTKRFAAVTLAATGVILGGAGAASADMGSSADGIGGSVAVTPQQEGLLNFDAPVANVPCPAEWSNGAVAGGVIAPGSDYAACDDATINQPHGESKGLV